LGTVEGNIPILDLDVDNTAVLTLIHVA